MLRKLTRFKKLSVVALKNTTKSTRVANGARFRARRLTQAMRAAHGMPCFSVAAISFICCPFFLSSGDVGTPGSGALHERLFAESGARELGGDSTLAHDERAIGDAE